MDDSSDVDGPFGEAFEAAPAGWPQPARGPLGIALRNARDRLLLSQRELARRAGVNQAVVSRLERGGREPSCAVFCTLLAAVELEPVVHTRRLRSAVERDIDARIEQMRDLSPNERWEEAWSPVSALLEAIAQVPALTGSWALDGDTALLGYGVPVEAATLTIAIRDAYPVEEGLREARSVWGDDIVARPLRPWPDPVLVTVNLATSGTGLVPVLPLERVQPD